MRHKPAFANQIINLLNLKSSDIFLDCTLGDGTHTEKALALGCRVISLDIDPDSIKRSKSFILSKQLQKNWQVYNTNFASLEACFKEHSLPRPNSILMDLGTSQNQLANLTRGFSFKSDNLDMRMNLSLQVTASDLINALSQKELTTLFVELADTRKDLAVRIAKGIVFLRKTKPITSAIELSKIIEDLLPTRHSRIHPATTIFQALRMAVNAERENLTLSLPSAFNLLVSGGTFGVISFHSGEDRIVKHFFLKKIKLKQATLLHKLLKPSKEELKNNNKIRSAKLRIIQKT